MAGGFFGVEGSDDFRNLVIKTLLLGFRPTVPVASSSRSSPDDEDKEVFLPATRIHSYSTSSTNSTTIYWTCSTVADAGYRIQMYDGIREFCYPDSANVKCTRWLSSPRDHLQIFCRSGRFCGILGWSYGWRLARIFSVSINHIRRTAVRFGSFFTGFSHVRYMDISKFFELDRDWIVHPLPGGEKQPMDC